MPEQKEVTFTLDGKLHTTKVIVATLDENLQSLNRWPLRIATIDYWATGEGQTVYLLARRATTQEEFFKWCVEQSNDWYVRGAAFYENTLPVDDRAFQMLASDVVKAHWQRILSGEIESGFYEYAASQHFNLS